MSLRTCTFVLALLAACGPRAPASTVTDGGEASTGPDGGSTATSTATSAAPTTGGSSGTSSFVMPPDVGAGFISEHDGSIGCLVDPGGSRSCPCDQWQPGCAEGSKCTSYAVGDGPYWNTTCVPLAPNPDHPGEPCTVEGWAFSGVDSCDIDSMCWHIDEETLTGTCVLRCKGTPEDPICPPDTDCMNAADGVLTLCLPPCDPLVPDCPPGETCVSSDSPGTEFLCLSDLSGDKGQLFGPCAANEFCDPGLVCRKSTHASECDPDDVRCCLPYCDTAAPPSCPGAMQQCLPWFTDEPAPPGLENLGVCGIPE